MSLPKKSQLDNTGTSLESNEIARRQQVLRDNTLGTSNITLPSCYAVQQQNVQKSQHAIGVNYGSNFHLYGSPISNSHGSVDPLTNDLQRSGDMTSKFNQRGLLQHSKYLGTEMTTSHYNSDCSSKDQISDSKFPAVNSRHTEHENLMKYHSENMPIFPTNFSPSSQKNSCIYTANMNYGYGDCRLDNSWNKCTAGPSSNPLDCFNQFDSSTKNSRAIQLPMVSPSNHPFARGLDQQNISASQLANLLPYFQPLPFQQPDDKQDKTNEQRPAHVGTSHKGVATRSPEKKSCYKMESCLGKKQARQDNILTNKSTESHYVQSDMNLPQTSQWYANGKSKTVANKIPECKKSTDVTRNVTDLCIVCNCEMAPNQCPVETLVTPSKVSVSDKLKLMTGYSVTKQPICAKCYHTINEYEYLEQRLSSIKKDIASSLERNSHSTNNYKRNQNQMANQHPDLQYLICQNLISPQQVQNQSYFYMQDQQMPNTTEVSNAVQLDMIDIPNQSSYLNQSMLHSSQIDIDAYPSVDHSDGFHGQDLTDQVIPVDATKQPISQNDTTFQDKNLTKESKKSPKNGSLDLAKNKPQELNVTTKHYDIYNSSYVTNDQIEMNNINKNSRLSSLYEAKLNSIQNTELYQYRNTQANQYVEPSNYSQSGQHLQEFQKQRNCYWSEAVEQLANLNPILNSPYVCNQRSMENTIAYDPPITNAPIVDDYVAVTIAETIKEKTPCDEVPVTLEKRDNEPTQNLEFVSPLTTISKSPSTTELSDDKQCSPKAKDHTVESSFTCAKQNETSINETIGCWNDELTSNETPQDEVENINVSEPLQKDANLSEIPQLEKDEFIQQTVDDDLEQLLPLSQPSTPESLRNAQHATEYRKPTLLGKTKKHAKLQMCRQCDQVFSNRQALVRHIERRHKMTTHNYSCNTCHRKFHSEKTLQSHMKSHKSYKCSSCKMIFNKKFLLKQHAVVCHIKLHKCKVCEKVTSSSQALIAHVKSHDRQEQIFQCEICDKIFSCKRNLIDHGLIHTGEKPFSCDNCDAKFRHHNNLTTHHRFCTKNQLYTCKECGKKFSQSSTYKRHLKAHKGEFKHKCICCDKGFWESRKLRIHFRMHDKTDDPICRVCAVSSNPTCTIRESPSSLTFSCSLCKKEFYRKECLSDHLNFHKGVRSHSCKECPRTYLYRSNLHQHILLEHRKIKRHVCKVCNKAFGKSSGLKSHARIHTEELPYSCESCGKAFPTSSNYKRHQKCHITAPSNEQSDEE